MPGQIYRYLTTEELILLDSILVDQDMAGRTISRFMPIRERRSSRVRLRRMAHRYGLMQPRGYDAPYPTVPRIGFYETVKEPSQYGESSFIDSKEIAERAQVGNEQQVVDINDLAAEEDATLVTRMNNRIAWLCWKFFLEGHYIVQDAYGTVTDEDFVQLHQFASQVAWNDLDDSTPLADLQAARLMARGKGVSFGPEARILMNQQTADWLISNRNAEDLGGMRTAGGSTIRGIGDVSEILRAQSLPQVEIVEDGYYASDDEGSFTLYLEDGMWALVGSRQGGGTVVGEFSLTTNPDNPDNSSRPFVKVVDTGRNPYAMPPRRVGVFRGFNGGPRLDYPEQIIIGDSAP